MADLTSNSPNQHHDLSNSTTTHQDKALEGLTNTLRSLTNPFTEQNYDLFNLVTKIIVPEKVKEAFVNQSQIGHELYGTFVRDRIQSQKTNLWSPLKKHHLRTWKDMGKKGKLSTGDKVVEIRQDRSLFARMMVVCKSRPEITLKEVIGQYKFSVVPRSMLQLMALCITVPWRAV